MHTHRIHLVPLATLSFALLAGCASEGTAEEEGSSSAAVVGASRSTFVVVENYADGADVMPTSFSSEKVEGGTREEQRFKWDSDNPTNPLGLDRVHTIVTETATHLADGSVHVELSIGNSSNEKDMTASAYTAWRTEGSLFAKWKMDRAARYNESIRADAVGSEFTHPPNAPAPIDNTDACAGEDHALRAFSWLPRGSYRQSTESRAEVVFVCDLRPAGVLAGTVTLVRAGTSVSLTAGDDGVFHADE